MGYSAMDRMSEQETAELRFEAKAYLKKNHFGAPKLADMSDVQLDVVQAFLTGETKRLSKPNYGKLWLALHPEK